jgi:hypothetical protein
MDDVPPVRTLECQRRCRPGAVHADWAACLLFPNVLIGGMLLKRVFQHQSCSVWHRFVGKHLSAYRKNLLHGAEAKAPDQEADVVAVTAPGSQNLHRQQVLW